MAHRDRPRPAAPSWAQRLSLLVCIGTLLALALPAAPAQAVTRSTLSLRLTTASSLYSASKTISLGFPSADRVRWLGELRDAGSLLASARRRLSAAKTQQQVDAAAPVVNRELQRAKVFRISTGLASLSFSARKQAVSAGQRAFTSWYDGSLDDASYAELRGDSGAVAALAAHDRRRAWSALGTLTAPAASQAKAALPALSTTARATTPSGWTAVPGGCALPAASSTWLGRAAQPGRHLWVDDAAVEAARQRADSGTDQERASARYLEHLADSLKKAVTTDASAIASAVQVRSSRLGFAALMGDAEADSWLRQDLATVVPPGPSTGNYLRDAISLEGLATDLDWTGLDEDASPSAQRLREALLVRWVGPLACRYDDLETTVTDSDNIAVIVNASALHAGYALAATEPLVARALARAALPRLVRGLGAVTADGGTWEGPSYWNLQGRYLAAAYGTSQAVYGDSPPVGLPDPQPLASYAWSSTTATGDSLAFSDSLVKPQRLRTSAVAWVAHTTDDPEAASLARGWLATPTEAFEVLWWPTEESLATPDVPRTSTLFPRTGLAALQAGETTAWLKGGSSRLTHTHLDLGSVGYARYGVQWAVDPGQGDYSLPAYMSRTADSQRWTYWNVASAGHSGIRPLSGQPPLRTIAFSAFEPVGTSASSTAGYARVDLAPVMPGASSASRTAALSTSGGLTVLDRVTSTTARSWTWGWVTEADVAVSGSGSTRALTLSQAGRTVTISLSGLPSGTSVKVVPAPDGTVGPTGRSLSAVQVTTGATKSLALRALVS